MSLQTTLAYAREVIQTHGFVLQVSDGDGVRASVQRLAKQRRNRLPVCAVGRQRGLHDSAVNADAAIPVVCIRVGKVRDTGSLRVGSIDARLQRAKYAQ